jgi:hypothetical protein
VSAAPITGLLCFLRRCTSAPMRRNRRMTLPKDLDNQIANDPELAFELLRLGVQNHICECVPRALADGCDLNEMVVFARHNPDAEISFRYSLGARKFTGPQPLLAEIEEILAGPLPQGTIPVVYQMPRRSGVFAIKLPALVDCTPTSASSPIAP